MNEREYLETQLLWLRTSVLPASTEQKSIQLVNQQILDIEWRLETDPPRPAPTCGWKGPYSSHPWPCPKNDTRCNAQMGIKSKPRRTRFEKALDVE